VHLWARLNIDRNFGLRRGAWYRVIRVTADEVDLEVNRQEANVPRWLLDIAEDPPRTWTIIARPADARGPALAWGDRYVVCPSCRTRARLKGHQQHMQCPRCRGRFRIAWDEWLG
jgi:hypothetical protein